MPLMRRITTRLLLLLTLFVAPPALGATWTSSPLPELNAGPSERGGGSKHIHCAENLDDGRLYCVGGDYGIEGEGSYQQKVWSTDPRILPITWRLDYPYHGPAGAEQPGRPDEAAFAWDSTRKLFWMWPGTYEDDGVRVNGVHTYPGAATGRWGMFTFDPAKPLIDRFKYIGGVITPEGRGKYGIYDAATDSLWAIGEFSQLWQYHIPTGRQTVTSIQAATTGESLSNARSNSEGVAQVGRELWVLEPYGGRAGAAVITEQWVLAYHLDTKKARVVTRVPALTGSDIALNTSGVPFPQAQRIDFSQLIHNPDLGVVYYIRHPGWNEFPSLSKFISTSDGWPTVYKYKYGQAGPDAARWSVLPVVATDSGRIRGIHSITYSRAAQRLFMMGGQKTNTNEIDPQTGDWRYVGHVKDLYLLQDDGAQDAPIPTPIPVPISMPTPAQTPTPVQPPTPVQNSTPTPAQTPPPNQKLTPTPVQKSTPTADQKPTPAPVQKSTPTADQKPAPALAQKSTPTPDPTPIPAPAAAPLSSPAPPTTGTWTEMVVLQHQRAFPRFRDPAGTEAAQPQASDYVPNRAWSAPIRVAPGDYRFHGGGHTDYPGNDVDRVVLDLAQKKVTVTQMRRPKVPVASDPMYNGGGGNPIDLGGGAFEPGTIHGWARQAYVPRVGYVFFNNNMVGGVQRYVLNRFDETTGKFEVLSTGLEAAQTGHRVGDQLLEWDDASQSLPILWGDENGTTHVHQYKPGQGITYVRSIGDNFVAFGSQSGGISRVYLGAGRHLIWRSSEVQNAGRPARLIQYDHGTGFKADVPVPSYAAGRELSLAVDRTNGMVYAGFKAVDRPQGANASLGIMRCPITDLGNWTRLELSGAPSWGLVKGYDEDKDGALQRQPLWIEAGHLVLIDFMSRQWVNEYWQRTRFLAVPLGR